MQRSPPAEASKLRVVMITQVLDFQDDLLGAIVGWCRELSRRVGRLDVIALRAGEYDLPATSIVTVVGTRSGAGRLARFARLQRALGASFARGVDVVFAHMCPEYALAAAPQAFLRGVPIVLWFVHRRVSPLLRASRYVAARIVTASLDSCRLPAAAPLAIGHGIDTEFFAPGRVASDGPVRVLAVGRVAPVKEYDVLVDALQCRSRNATAGPPLHVRIAGRIETPEEKSCHAALKARLCELGLSGTVEFLGPVPYAKMPALMRESHLFLNLTRAGSFDKSAMEAMSCGLPTITPNSAFFEGEPELDAALVVAYRDPNSLAQRLSDVAALDSAQLEVMRARLRSLALRRFSTSVLASRLAQIFLEVVQRR
ncbi:MAG: glycosyltransferase family 4 protein [Candidatus Riflebacteria bacterium]|nr:glycosyltransferase family 4 protein [Candidatus Riflebacteria bacterium]